MDSRLDMDIHDAAHQRRLAEAVMRRQITLSLKIAAVFLVILLGLPMVNYLLPGLANLRIGGFTLTWLFLAVLFYPVTWFLSWVFVRRSNDIEAEIARDMRHGNPDLPVHPQGDPVVLGAEYVAASEKNDPVNDSITKEERQ